MTFKREPVKTIRDYIKKDYKARDCCYVCGVTENLEIHHLYSVSELFSIWCIKNSITTLTSDEQVRELRVPFAQDMANELSHDNLFTLCGKHHKHLHNVYGQTYSNHLVPKIKKWLELQKEKHGR